MADNLHLNVVAEGIETEEDVEFLCENKVKIAQGYYFSKPLPTEKFDILLDKIVQKNCNLHNINKDFDKKYH